MWVQYGIPQCVQSYCMWNKNNVKSIYWWIKYVKPLIQIALKLLCIKLKTKEVIIQTPMESVRQSVMYRNSYKLKVGKQRCINRWKINHVDD
jgi:hypothetical protein